MSSTLVRLVLLVSCAHALVHVYELALPSVEQLIAADFQVGKDTTGVLATSFRLPFGMFAIAVGWLVDRYGAKKLLSLYLLGCAAMACAVAVAPNLPALFLAMFALGTFASMYHPAGLALISIEASPEHRPRVLGAHGIFGSAGIGGAPFFAAAVLAVGAGWRGYFALLAIPGLLLGIWLILRLADSGHAAGRARSGASAPDPDENPRWASYFLITVLGCFNGFTYAAFLSFLPRYLDKAATSFFSSQPEAERNVLTGLVLILGMLGQYIAGRIARPGKLELTLAAIVIGCAPLLAGMAMATGSWRVVLAAGFALVHFMTQPIYNTLIAEYVPRRRRSLGYGFSFMMAFGIGSLGATFAGYADQWVGAASGDRLTYGVLAALAVVSSLIAAHLWYWNHSN